MPYPPFVGRTPVKIKPDADFQPEEFRRKIKSKGLNAVWQTNSECPCVTGSAQYGITLPSIPSAVVSNQQDPLANCPVCGGDGYILHSPTPIRLFVATFISDPGMQTFGEYTSGTVMGTFLPESLPAYGDRITLTDCTLRFRETRARDGLTQALRYPVTTRTLDLETGNFDVGVVYCHKADSDGVAIPGGVLYQDEDFEVLPDGSIDWALGDAAGTAPAEGDRFSMDYFASPVYVVEDIPFSVRDTLVKDKRPQSEHVRMVVQAKLVLEFYNTQKDA